MSNLVIVLRGTNGAGKSTIVREVMNDYERRETHERPDRRRPLGYWLTGHGLHSLYVPGHYEIANGGIDTLRSLEELRELATDACSRGFAVLFEGKNMQDKTVTTLATQLLDAEYLNFVHIDHPVDECIFSVRRRGHSISESTIRSIDRRVRRNTEELIAQGYNSKSLSRQDALIYVRGLLRRN